MTKGNDDFAEFYRTSWAPCLRAVIAWNGDPRLAEDLVAEAFSKAWASWKDVARHPAPRAWVVRTALNTGVSWWRRARREVSLAGEGPAALSALGDGREGVLLAALWRLPTRERQVVALRLLLDLDTKTTAKQLGIAPGTVRAHLSRAVAALRQEPALMDTVEVTECTTTATI